MKNNYIKSNIERNKDDLENRIFMMVYEQLNAKNFNLLETIKWDMTSIICSNIWFTLQEYLKSEKKI
jgi:hypothetical protein